MRIARYVLLALVLCTGNASEAGFADLWSPTNATAFKPAATNAFPARVNPLPSGPTASAPAPTVPFPNSAPSSTNATPASLAGYVPDDKYKLRVGDKVAFQILEDQLLDPREVPKELVVADSGELDVPYVGRVAAVDKTPKQLCDELKSQLEKEYYKQATVIIALNLANRYVGRIYVWGQVRTQGPIDIALNENLTVGKAILRAGGFADFANKKKIKVIRPAGAGGTGKQTFNLNMVEILEQGKTEKDLLLQPEDFIIVPSRLVNF